MLWPFFHTRQEQLAGAPWPFGAFQDLMPKEVQGLGQRPQARA